MTDFTVQKEKSADGGRYVVHIPGIEGEAELVWIDGGPGVIVAVHTLAPDSMRGMGVASAMVNRLIADARKERLRIVPQCPYVRAQFDRHPDWADLRAAP